MLTKDHQDRNIKLLHCEHKLDLTRQMKYGEKLNKGINVSQIFPVTDMFKLVLYYCVASCDMKDIQ